MATSGHLGQIAVILLLAIQRSTGGLPDQSLCRPEYCADYDISCPDDSKPIEIHPIQISDADALNATTKNPITTELANPTTTTTKTIITTSTYTTSTKPPQNTYTNDDNNNNNEDDADDADDDDDDIPLILSNRTKRSVLPYKRRESIKIVPGGYIHKRSIPTDDDDNNNPIMAELDPSDAATFLQKCCEQLQCVCDTLCYQPKCADDEVLILEQEATMFPGNCCPIYKCHPIRQTQQEQDEITSCFSAGHKEHFHHGDTWKEDDCMTCECENGQTNCKSSVCKPINCENKIYIRGECCPVCDTGNSKYCLGQENCDIVCRYGYEIDVTGCTICRCVKSPSSTYPIDDHDHHHHRTDVHTNDDDDDTNMVHTIPTDVSIDNINLTPTFDDFVYNYFLHISLSAIILVIIVLSFWKYLQNKKNNRTYNIVPSV